MSHTRGGSVVEGQNVVRKSSKRSRLILGAAVASALAGMTASSVRAVNYSWNGNAVAPSFWDVGSNWAPAGPPLGADNATFGAGAVDFSVDLHAGTQVINNVTFNNATGSYLLSNGGLSIGGTLINSGAATNTIGARVTASGDWTVSGGTLRVTNISNAAGNNFQSHLVNVGNGATFSAAGGSSINNYSNAANNATVSLGNGGTFTANGRFGSENNALLAAYYDTAINQGNAAQKFGRLAPDLATAPGLFTLVPSGYSAFKSQLAVSDQGQAVGPFGTQNIVGIAGGAIVNHDDFAVAWTGSLHVSAANAGTWQFATNSDDGSVIYIDLNGNGVFDNTGDPTTTELIVNNNFDQGPTTNTNAGNGVVDPLDPAYRPPGHPSLSLAAGDYKVAIGWFEGRVTGSMIAAFNNPTVAANPTDPNTWTFVNPGDAGQAGMWSYTNTVNAKYDADYTTTNVTVAASANSTVNVDAVSARFGNLTMGGGSTLNVTGSGPATFAATTASGIVTFNTAQNTFTGTLSTGSSITRLNKQGAATLVLSDAASTGLSAASTVSVQAGMVQAAATATSNAIHGASISLDGGVFRAQSSSGYNGLKAQYYSGPNSHPLLDPITNLMALTQSSSNILTGNLSFSDNTIGTDIVTASGNAVGVDNFSVLWTGRLNISAANAGRYIFSSTSDDGTVMWLDLNHNGKFDQTSDPATTELIISNNVYQGPTRRDNNSTSRQSGVWGHPNLDLAAGSYDVAMGWYEGGGGAEATFTMNGPATGGAETVINPTLQFGVWTAVDADPNNSPVNADFSTSNVVVTQDSAIDVLAPVSLFGNLTISAGKNLTISGQGLARFAQTTVGGEWNAIIDPDGASASMAPGRLVNGGGLTGITKTGAGTLILDNTSAASVLTGAMHINVNNGGLVGTTDGVNNPLGAAPIALANGTALTLSSKVATPVTFANAVSGTGNISITAANRGSGAVDNGVVSLSTLTVSDGGTLNLAANNGYSLSVGQANLGGNITINNNSSDTNITLGNISGAGSSVISVKGSNRTRITGNVTGSSNIIITSPGITFDPGAATKTVSANTELRFNTGIRVASGVVDYGQNVINGASHYEAGLLETFANGSFYEGPIVGAPNSFNVPQSIQLEPRRANQAYGNTNGSDPGTNGNAPGWTDNSTYIYSGQINVPDNGTADGIGHIAFFMRFDDSVSLKVDGATIMRDTAWNNATSSGELALSAGWHDIEMRFGEGGGGVGANWVGPVAFFIDGTGAGVGLQTDPTLGFDPNSGTNNAGNFNEPNIRRYNAPRDDGTMNLFRSLVANGGTIDVDAGGELKVGGLASVGKINLNGTGTIAKLTLSDHASASNSDVGNLNLVGGSSVGEVRVGNNTSLTATNVNIDANGTLTKSGTGLLRATGTLVNGGSIIVSGGKLQANGVGSGPGSITVQSGGTLGGSGSVGGPVTVNSGGSLSPHDGTGTATLTLNDALNMDTGARLDFNFGTFGDSVKVLANLTLNGNTTLNLNAITGFTVGTYRLLTMTNFSNTGDVVLGTNNGPSAFNYSIAETVPSGVDPGHIDLIVTAQQYKWTGTQNNVWDINGAINWLNPASVPAKYMDLVAVTMDNSGSNRNINITPAGGVAPASITVNNDAAHAYSIGGNAITGPTGILKQGVGTLTLTGSNTYIGPVSIENGTVSVNALANGGTASPLGTGTLGVGLGSATTAGTLQYTGGGAASTDRGIVLAAGGGIVDTAQSVAINGIVSGAGAFTKTGAGTLTLGNAANTMSGSLNANGGTLSAASLGAGDAGSVIGVANGATFDYSGGNNTNTRGVNVAATGGNIGVSNASSNLTLSGAVNGPTLGKSGPGTLNLGGLVTYTGTTHSIATNSGTIAYTGTGGNTINGTYGVNAGSTLRGVPGSLGTVTVGLNGGTLSLQGAADNRGLKGEFFQFTPTTAMLDTLDAFNQALIDNAGTQYATASTGLADLDPRPDVHGAINHIAGGGNPFDQYGGIAAPAGFDNLVTRWTGKIHISPAQAGSATIFSASDDGMKIWIDGVEVVNNNFFQGITERSGVADLTAGDHDIVIGYYEGGGDANLIVSWTPVGGSKQVVPNSVLFAANPNAAYGNNVATTAGTTSTIDVANIAIANLGSLNLGNGSTLQVTSGGAAFTGTTLPVAGGTYNINSDQEINLKQVTGSGTLNHSGTGAMVIEATGLPGLGAGSVINVNAGTVGVVSEPSMPNPLGTAPINLFDGGGLLVAARSGDVTYDNAVSGTGNVRIGSGAFGSATAGPHILTVGSAARPVSLAHGSTAALGANSGTLLLLPAVQLAGDATLNNSSGSDNVTIGNINMTGGSATFGGSKQMRLTGNISGAVTNVLINSGALNVDPGAAGTSNINGPAKILTVLNANTGTTNFGNNKLTGQARVRAAGLTENFADGGFYEGPLPGNNSYPDLVPQNIQLEPRRAQVNGATNGAPPGQGGVNAPGWTDNSTYIYSGQILVPDNDIAGDGVGKIAFFMRFDDSVSLKIDGVSIMRDQTWNNATSSGAITDGVHDGLTVGWHDIEMRFGEGGGGVGANWVGPPALFADGTPAGVGLQTDASLGFDDPSGFDGTGNAQNVNITRYFAPRDNGTMNLFRTDSTPLAGTINVAAGATLTAGGLVDMMVVNLNGGAAGTTMNLSSTSTHVGNAGALNANGAAGDRNTVNLGGNNTLNVNVLNVADGTIFNKTGLGTLRVVQVPDAVFEGIPNINSLGNSSEVHVNAGNLIINAPGGAGTGSVFVAGGATLGGKGSITGSVSVDPAGHITPGDGVGTLTVGGFQINSSILDLEGDVTGFDKVKVNSSGAGDVTTFGGNSTINLADLGVTVGPHDFVIIDYNNATPIADALAHLHLGTIPGSFTTATLVNDTANQDIILRLVVAPSGAEWNVDASGSWGVATNWFPNIVPDGNTAIASFLGKITAPRTVTLDGNRTVASINFQNANTYTIASGTGGTLTVLSQVNLTLGSHVISAPLAFGDNTTVNGPGTLTASGGVAIGAGKTLTKTGAGTLTLSGAQGHGAGAALAVNQGVVNLNSNAGVPATPASSNLSVSISGSAGNAKVSTGANQDLKELSIPFANAGTQTLDLSSPAGAGQFHSVTVYSANLAAAKAALYNAIVNANKAGAADPNDGITDSGLHSGAKIGLAQTANSIYIRPTKPGDLNLDGAVTISDFIDLASNFNTVGTATWQEGDLNYDHNVTVSDFIDFAANFNSSYTGSAGPISASDAQTLASFASSIGVDPGVIGSAVPEPGTLGLLAVGALGLMSRRRRKA